MFIVLMQINILPVDVPQIMLENILVHQLKNSGVLVLVVFLGGVLVVLVLLAIRKVWALRNLC